MPCLALHQRHITGASQLWREAHGLRRLAIDEDPMILWCAQLSIKNIIFFSLQGMWHTTYRGRIQPLLGVRHKGLNC